MKTKNTDITGKINVSKKILVKPCIFPFTYKDTEYNSCYKGSKGDWCATEIDPKTNKFTKWAYCDSPIELTKKIIIKTKKSTTKKTNKSKKSKLDIELIPKTNLKTISEEQIFANIYDKDGEEHKTKHVKAGKCIFPFVYNKKEYNECYPGKKGKWCATEVDSKTQKLLKYGYCISSAIKAASNNKYEKAASNNKSKKAAANNKSKKAAANNKYEKGAANTKSKKAASNNKSKKAAANNKSKKAESKKRLINWVARKFQDPNYKIVETIAQGDCFFDSIRLGLLTNNEKLSISDLREHLYYAVNQNQFNLFKTLLENAKIEKDKEVIQEYRFIENIDTLQELKDKLLTPSFWADSWAIGIIEQSLNIKVLILAEDAFNRGDIDNVITCGDMVVTDNEPVCSICGLKFSQRSLSAREMEPYILKHKEVPDHNWVDSNSILELNPRGYVIVTYSGNHYRLVTYSGKGFFESISELPVNIALDFYNKCVVKTNFKGSYSSIKEFRELSI